MPYRKETFRAPGIYEVKKYYSYRAGGPKTRAPNTGETDEVQRKNNSRRARENLYRVIATNFVRDDFRIDLTYEDPPPDPPEAKKRIQRFLRNLRGAYRKRGAELKYIYVTEHRGHRIHHHLLINEAGLSRADIQKCWPYAKFNYRSFRYYDGTPEDAKRLAQYLTKETDKSIREEDAIQKQRWVPSRNLKRPDVKKETIKAKRWQEKPKPPKGYQLAEVMNGYTKDGYPYQYARFIPLAEKEIVWPTANRKKESSHPAPRKIRTRASPRRNT